MLFHNESPISSKGPSIKLGESVGEELHRRSLLREGVGGASTVLVKLPEIAQAALPFPVGAGEPPNSFFACSAAS